MLREQSDGASKKKANEAPDPVRGALSGLVGGLVASGAMSAFQSAWQIMAGSSPSGSGEPSTVQAAEKIAALTSKDPISEDAKPEAGKAVHYAFGAGLGTLYGVAAEYWPQITSGFGTAFGIGATLFLDDALVPAAGLGKPPARTSLGTHAYSATSHVIYGGALEATRRLIRSTA